MRRPLHKTLAAAALALTASPAMATPIAQVSGSTLTGASGVEVNGVSYNVSFQHGACATVFGAECADPGDFTFSNSTSALAASQALRQLFNDVFNVSGAAQSIGGCAVAANSCYVVTPYAASGAAGNTSFAVTYASLGAGFGSTTVSDSFFSSQSVTSAVWSVPEPPSAALVLPAAAALLATRRRKHSA